MRTHTALHVLCGVIWKQRATRMDFEFDPLPEGFGPRVRELVNAELAADRSVAVSFLPRGEAIVDADLFRTKVG